MGFASDLKKSILQMAVSGKLTKQLKSDGNAKDLYDDIQVIKEQLIKDKKIKKEKTIKEIDEEDLPFDIPKNWKWVKFCDIVYYRLGKTPPRVETSSWGADYRWISIADMIPFGVIKSTKEGISNDGFIKYFKSTFSPKGTLIMSFKLTIGRVSILGIDAVHNEAIISIFPFINANNIMRDYLFNIMELLCNYVNSNNAIKGKTLNSDNLDNILVPLPPLAEQQRIIDKLNKIMPELNEIEKIENEIVKISKN